MFLKYFRSHEELLPIRTCSWETETKKRNDEGPANMFKAYCLFSLKTFCYLVKGVLARGPLGWTPKSPYFVKVWLAPSAHCSCMVEPLSPTRSWYQFWLDSKQEGGLGSWGERKNVKAVHSMKSLGAEGRVRTAVLPRCRGWELGGWRS